jgi:sugar phosphate isomerase/epimerase
MTNRVEPMPRPLVLCHFTAVELAPPAFVDLADRAGFTAVSLMLQFPSSYGPGFPVLGDTPMRRDTKLRLDDTGLVLFDASTCRLEPETTVDDFRPMVESAAYLGARSINVNGSDPDETRLTDHFAALCELADEYEIAVGLEFMMSTRVRTIGDALRLIERSAATNASVTVDALHLTRSGGSAQDVARLGAAQLSYVQLCDGPNEVPAEGYAHEGATERLLPGDGVLPLQPLIDAVGPDVPLGIEAPSARRCARGISDDDYSARAMRALRVLLRDG